MRCYCILIRITKIKNADNTIALYAGEDTKQLEPSHIAGENAQSYWPIDTATLE